MIRNRRRNLVRSRWIRAALAVAFGSFGAGFITMLAQALRPNLISLGVAFLVMAVIPLAVVAVLDRLPAKEMPKPDPDSLINIAGLLVTAGGFNLIPIWKWFIDSSQTEDGWLYTPLPEPDLSLPNIFFTGLALSLSVVALYRGFKDPNQKIAQLRAAKKDLQEAKADLLNVVKRTSDSPKLKQLQARLATYRFSKKSDENQIELHKILTEYLASLRKKPLSKSSRSV